MRGLVFYIISSLFLAFATVIGSLLPSSHDDLGYASPTGEVVVATYEGVINPVAAEYLHDALTTAQTAAAKALIIRLDTPGGLDTSMRLIVKDITAATIPVVVFVAPSGGRAASAGVFITLSAHIAAMSPGTNIGAAHPVAMGGGEMDKTMKEKVENDAVAYIKTIAEQHRRNVVWAENAVRKSLSATETEALKLKIIDLVAEDVPTLLRRIHGRTITLTNGSVTLETDGTTIREYPMGLRLEMLKALSDPNVAYLLMTLGTIGLLAELYNPGAILPGIVGAISLILAFYSLQSLPVNYAGVLLLICGIVFLVLEISVTSYGLLALGGITSMILGGLLLIKSDAPYLQVSLSFLLPTVLTVAAMVAFAIWLAVTNSRQRPVTGVEGMIGEIGIATTDLTPHGQVTVHGELWEAVSREPIKRGEEAEVTSVQGLTLTVAPPHKPSL